MKFARKMRRARGPMLCVCGKPLYYSDNPYGPKTFCNNGACDQSHGKPYPPEMIADFKVVRM